jgi:hypothetical protein
MVLEMMGCPYTHHQLGKTCYEEIGNSCSWQTDFKTLKSVVEPSPPVEKKVIFKSKSQATITLMLSVPFLFLKGEAFSEEIEIGI